MGATVFPATLDTLASLPKSPRFGLQAPEGVPEYLFNQILAAIVAIEAKVGVDDSAVAASLNARAPLLNAGVPASGTAGTGAGVANPMLYDTIGLMLYVNENTVASPYWTPVWTPGINNTYGAKANFRDGQSILPIAGSAMSAYTSEGVRVFGDGCADSDSGIVPIAPSGESGQPIGRATTTNEDLHTIAVGGTTQSYQPDQHGGAIMDVEVTNNSAITTRSQFFGWVGTAIDAMLTPATIATTVITNVLADMAGMAFDTDATDGDALIATINASNGNPTIDFAVVTGNNLGVNIAAAGTFQRFRVEVGEDGSVRMFIDKALVFTGAAASLDVDEELSPIAQLMSGAISIATMDLRSYFHIWNRSTS